MHGPDVDYCSTSIRSFGVDARAQLPDEQDVRTTDNTAPNSTTFAIIVTASRGRCKAKHGDFHRSATMSAHVSHGRHTASRQDSSLVIGQWNQK